MSERLKESVLKTEVSRIPGVRIPLHPWICQRINCIIFNAFSRNLSPLEHSTYKERVEDPPLPLVFVVRNRQAISDRLRPFLRRAQRKGPKETKKGAETSKYLPAGTRCGDKQEGEA